MLSTAVLHQGALSPSLVVHLSWILLPKVNGNTQLPQVPVVFVGAAVEGLGLGLGEGVGVGAAVEPEVLFHPPAKGAQVIMSGICWFSQSLKYETSA